MNDTLQAIRDEIRATLAASGIPSREIRVYGSQIMITARGYQSAQRWAMLLQRMGCTTVRGPGESLDEKADAAPGDSARNRYIRVWRVWATV